MKKKTMIKKMLIRNDASIFETLKVLNLTGKKCLFVINKKKKLVGSITDGDLRRYIIKNKNFDGDIKSVYNKKPIFLIRNKNFEIKKSFKEKYKNLIIPILNNQKIPIDYFPRDDEKDKIKLSNKVIIMAGGKGKRLKPYTNILPKPLIPLNGKPMILNILDEFNKYSFGKFIISIRQNDKVLSGYLNQYREKYDLNFFNETKPLGTGGCLKKIKNLKEDFFVVNCDTYLKINLQRILRYHIESNSLITLVACMKTYSLPYGECKLDRIGNLKNLIEKPNKKYFTNTGMYIFNPKISKYLPNKKTFGIDEIIKRVLIKKKKISIFPINENEWKDTGNWNNYFEAIQKK